MTIDVNSFCSIAVHNVGDSEDVVDGNEKGA
jgi:hypothetical protein